MAVANLHETILAYRLRKISLQEEINNLLSTKNLATYKQADVFAINAQEKEATRNYFKELYDNDPELQEKYSDYTEIPDFDQEMDKITAQYNDEIDELNAWETQLDAQITTNSAEMEEINAYMDALKSMLQSNLQEDFNYGSN